MSCGTQVETYFKLKYEVQQVMAEHEPQPGLLKKLEAEEYAADTQLLACVHSQPAITPIFPLGGVWKYGGKPGPVISCQGVLMNIDMSAYPGLAGTGDKTRPTAGGCILTSTTIWVYFPDDNVFTGTLHAPNRIVWSNGSEWDKA